MEGDCVSQQSEEFGGLSQAAEGSQPGSTFQSKGVSGSCGT